MDTIGERIKIALRERDMKQSELANLTGIHKSAISSYINGKYEPKQNAIFQMAKALNVNEAWLMGYDDVDMEKASSGFEELKAFAASKGIAVRSNSTRKTIQKKLQEVGAYAEAYELGLIKR